MPFRVVSCLLYSTVYLISLGYAWDSMFLERGKQPDRNNLIPIFALYSADVWSAGPVEAGDSVLAACELPPIQLGGIASQ